MHALATLVGIEAVLAAVAYTAARGSPERACLYLLGITAPLEVYRTTMADVNLSLFRLSLMLALAVVVVIRLRERRFGLGPAGGARLRDVSPILLAYALLAAVVGASFLIHGEALFLGKRLFAVLLVGVLAIVVCTELSRRTSVRTLATAIAAGAVLPVLASLWQVVALRVGEPATLPFLSSLPIGAGLERARAPGAGLAYGFVEGSTQRLKGTFVDPNHFASYLVFALMIAVALSLESALRRRTERAVAFGALAAAAAAVLVGAYSRSGWGAAAVATAVLIALAAPLLRARTTPRQRQGAAIVAVVFVALVVVPLGSAVSSRLNPRSGLNATTNAVHEANGKAGLEQFRKHPAFGIGVGGLGILLDEEVRNSAADSTYVTVAAELGAVGLFALLLTAGFAVEALIRAHRRERGDPGALLSAALLGAYAGFILANLFYDQLWWRDFHFLVVGLVVALSVRPLAARRARSEAPAAVP